MGRLDRKVAVITGAASGIGRGTALCLAREGAAVVAADLNSQGGEQVIGEIAAAGGRALFQHTDVSSEPDIKALVDRAVSEYGQLDVLFNNAGLVGAVGPIEKVSADDWDKTIAVLLRAVFLGIKYAVEPMRKASKLHLSRRHQHSDLGLTARLFRSSSSRAITRSRPDNS